MERILVTGGAGFIGSDLVRHLTAHTNCAVTVLDKLTAAATTEALADLDPARVDLIVGDVADATLVDRLVRDHDTVIHCAAESHNDNALRDPAPFVHTNLVGTFTILEAVRAHDVRLHHVSTDEVFGDLPTTDRTRFDEASPYLPGSPYAATKAGADHLVRAWVRSFGVRATLSCSSNNYGPWQHVEKFIPRQVTNALSGRPVKLFGSGAQVRDWIHVADHSAALLAILQRGRIGETYLVGADCQWSNVAVVDAILRLLGTEVEVEHVADRAGHDQRYAINADKLRVDLGWEPAHTDFEAGLADTIAWYRNHERWWRPAKEAVEAAYASCGQ